MQKRGATDTFYSPRRGEYKPYKTNGKSIFLRENVPPTYTNPVPPPGSFRELCNLCNARNKTKAGTKQNKSRNKTKQNNQRNKTIQYKTKESTKQNKTEIKEFRYHEVKRVNSNKNTPDTFAPTHFTFRFRFLFHFLIHRQIN